MTTLKGRAKQRSQVNWREAISRQSGWHGPGWEWSRARRMENSQAVRGWFKVHPIEPLPHLPVGGRVPRGNDGLARAQQQCRWDIEGMLRLLKAISDAPDLTENQVHRHERQTLKALKERKAAAKRKAYRAYLVATDEQWAMSWEAWNWHFG